ncbi:DNA-binding protein [Candidatus Thorarchaeota archaeon]|nr:DNA-binding protein [Candidatus Thorarchaeota archaeon]TFG98828.1 MAG: DNA-binding protein [Candidatus Thorarchaeota archaeon]
MVRTFVTSTTGRVIVVRLEPGEDIIKSIESIVAENKLQSGHLSLIGAVSNVHLRYFDLHEKVYKDFTIDEDLEIVSCIGNISRLKDDYIVHAHVVASDVNGKCYAGHLMEGCEVSVTIEIVITEFPKMSRARDEVTGLNLLDL